MASGRKGSGWWIALLAAAAIAAASAYFFFWRGAAAPPSAATGPAAAGPDSGTPAAASAQAGESAQRTDLTIADLLRNAGAAVAEKRLIDPPGNNAVEFYLLVLGREPNNAAAQEGLREMFSLAAGEVEQRINAGQIDEGRRAIDLLGKFDANNYTLTILRNKLDLRKKQMDREQEKRDQEKALAANAGRNTEPAAAAAAPAAAESKPAAADTAAKAALASAAPKPVPATAPAPAPASAPPAAETRAAVPISQPPPRYPAEAFRSRLEGWVEVAFTVAADGSVKNGSVVTANPPRLFNTAALRGIADWKFQPKLENGQPVEQQVRTRIEFKLPDK